MWRGILITSTRDSALEGCRDQKGRDQLVGVRVTQVTNDSLSLGESRALAREHGLMCEAQRNHLHLTQELFPLSV